MDVESLVKFGLRLDERERDQIDEERRSTPRLGLHGEQTWRRLMLWCVGLAVWDWLCGSCTVTASYVSSEVCVNRKVEEDHVGLILQLQLFFFVFF